MPRDSGGTYTLPAGSTATTGTTILASELNTPLSDIASALTASLPVDGSKGMSGALKAANGSASTPSFTFGSETNSGFYRNGAGDIRASIVTADVMTLGASAVTIMTAANSLVGNPTGSAALSTGVTLGAGLAFSGGVLGIDRAFSPPQGRLTLVSGTPVMTSDQTTKSTVYYTPYIGNLIPIPNGNSFAISSFSELSLVLNSLAHLADTVYDVFVALNPSGGAVVIGTGPAWSTSTAGSGARGTGAGTTECTSLNGLPVNANAITLTNNTTTYSIAQECAIRIGSILINGTGGQVSCTTSVGQSRKWAIANDFNKRKAILQIQDSTTSWTYGTASWRSSNGSSLNTGRIVSANIDDPVEIQFSQLGQSASTGSLEIGVGINVTDSPSGKIGQVNTGASASTPADMNAIYNGIGLIGANAFNSIEIAGGGGANLHGGSNMLMTIAFMA